MSNGNDQSISDTNVQNTQPSLSRGEAEEVSTGNSAHLRNVEGGGGGGGSSGSDVSNGSGASDGDDVAVAASNGYDSASSDLIVVPSDVVLIEDVNDADSEDVWVDASSDAIHPDTPVLDAHSDVVASEEDDDDDSDEDDDDGGGGVGLEDEEDDDDYEPNDGDAAAAAEDDDDDDDDEGNESDMDLGEDDDDEEDEAAFAERRRQLFDELRTPRHRNDIMRRMLNAMMTAMMGQSRAEIEEEEEEASAPRENPEVQYDVELPGAHTYLGNDLEDHTGRTVLEEESLHTIPLHTHSGVVLMPGEVLPLHIHHPHTISMMKNIIQTHRTFGVAHQNMLIRGKNKKMIGVTAEIFSSKEEGDDFRMMSLKAMGRQRFEIVETTREATGVQVARVRMLPEVWFSSPLDGGTSGSGSFAVDMDDDANQEQMNKFLGLTRNKPKPPRFDENARDAIEEETAGKRKAEDTVDDRKAQGGGSHAWRKRLRRRRGGHCLSADMTVWPSWVYSQYEAHDVMEAIKKELRCWDSSSTMNKIPQDPVQFSFWVAGNLPVDDGLRLHLLGINCANQRLRAELAILKKCTILQCRTCGTEITNTAELFSMSKTGPQSAYVNPSGFVFETLTVYKAKNILFIGTPNPEYSWFPGYAWTSGSCRNCHNQMGWRFTVTKEKEGHLVPSKFYGITRRSIKPGLDSSAFDLEEEDKKERDEREAKERDEARKSGQLSEEAEEEEEDDEEEKKKKKKEKIDKTWLPVM